MTTQGPTVCVKLLERIWISLRLRRPMRHESLERIWISRHGFAARCGMDHSKELEFLVPAPLLDAA